MGCVNKYDFRTIMYLVSANLFKFLEVLGFNHNACLHLIWGTGLTKVTRIFC